MSFGFLHLSGAIPAFHDRFPQITVEAVMNDRFVDLIDEGYDVALRIGDLRDSSLVARRPAPCWSVLCASPAYLPRRCRPARPADRPDPQRPVYSHTVNPPDTPPIRSRVPPPLKAHGHLTAQHAP